MDKESPYPWKKGTLTWTYDATANDSDKSFTVPTGKVWKLLAVQFHIAATATVGNRLMAFVVTDGTNIIFTGPAFTNVAASQTGSYHGAPGLADQTTVVPRRMSDGVSLATSGGTFGLSSEMYLNEGYVVRIYDGAAIDAAADDLIVALHYIEYDSL